VSGERAEVRRTDPVRLYDFAMRPGPTTWLFLGDSVTAGIRYTLGARSFPELFHERLRELGRTRDAVINTAVSGWTSADLDADLDWVALRHHPDVAIVGIGLNDAKQGLAGLDGFQERLLTLVRRLRETGAHVVLQTPAGTMPSAPKPVVMHLPAYVTVIRNLARSLEVELVDHDADWQRLDPGVREELFARGCHPNATGHIVMAATLIRAARIWDPEASRVGRARWV
jgi:acyl-CoA thioesterase-1